MELIIWMRESLNKIIQDSDQDNLSEIDKSDVGNIDTFIENIDESDSYNIHVSSIICNNDWKCKTCGTNGHISKDCTAEFDKNSQSDSEVSSEESDEVSEDESEKGEEIVSSQSTENLLDTCTPHTEETSKNADLPKDTNNIHVQDQNPSELKSDEPAQQSPEQNLKKKDEKEKKHPNQREQLTVHWINTLGQPLSRNQQNDLPPHQLIHCMTMRLAQQNQGQLITHNDPKTHNCPNIKYNYQSL
ncbi:CNBP [Mytilus coruscus]|uniref:CNBP n=1 Tax=Mytilus coruscus TaxID=42192 RepID=A0A6J8BGA5_MYTCO|nr:CNBP [Mytilus coruscus]